MPKKRKRAEGYETENGFQLPPPHDHLYLGHTEEEDRMLDALMRAGETLASPLRGPDCPERLGNHAEPVVAMQTPYPSDYTALLEIVERIRELAAHDTRLTALLNDMPRVFGDGEGLKALFRRLFPDPPAIPKTPDPDEARLSPREIEVLREASSEASRTEIAERLGISESTVNTHLDNIYRKLGVYKPIQAVARAAAKGYLEIDSLEFIKAANNCNVGDFEAVGTLLAHTFPVHETPGNALREPLAQFGLLLLALCAPIGIPLASDSPDSAPRRGVVCEIDSEGRTVRVFEEGLMRRARSMVIVPPYAMSQGFTPGNLLVAHDLLPQQRLNFAGIAEFTSDGCFVRAFCGANSVALRLKIIESPCFAPDGRLLVPSGLMTDGLLAFSDGGRKVQRFANGAFVQVCAGSDGRIYASQASGAGSIIKVFDGGGQLVNAIGGTDVGIRYCGLTVSSSGHIFVVRFTDHANHNDGTGFIEAYNMEGSLLCEFAVPGLSAYSQLVVDAKNRLYIPCERTGDIKIVTSEGRIERRIVLQRKIIPHGVALGADNRLWVCGQEV